MKFKFLKRNAICASAQIEATIKVAEDAYCELVIWRAPPADWMKKDDMRIVTLTNRLYFHSVGAAKHSIIHLEENFLFVALDESGVATGPKQRNSFSRWLFLLLLLILPFENKEKIIEKDFSSFAKWLWLLIFIRVLFVACYSNEKHCDRNIACVNRKQTLA